MSKKTILVNEEELTALIDGLDLKDTKKNEYLKARWLNYVRWWDSRATDARRKYFALRSAVVIAGALVPAFGRPAGVERLGQSGLGLCRRIDRRQSRGRYLCGSRRPV